MHKIAWTTLSIGLVAVLLGQPSAQDRPAGVPPSAYLHTDSGKIVDSAGRAVVLIGINWFGLETPDYAPHGLWARNWESLLDQIRDLGFNAIRLPYSNQLLDPANRPRRIDYGLNPDLKGLSGLEIMDRVIAGAGARGLWVILDRHRPSSQRQSDLWYTERYDEDRWIEDWLALVERYSGEDTVIGVDLHNEPHGRATWGSGDPATDWRLAAERAGRAIQALNPKLLIIVQGVDEYQGDWYWWGGNLMGALEHPVRLDRPDQLVYSTHDYGPGVYPQPWFWDPSFPDNLEGIWRRHWAYLQDEGIAPVIVGEFGGRSVGADREGTWQRRLVAYLKERGFSYFYWSLNPNSGDTGGLLLDDWSTVDQAKLALLSEGPSPFLGQGREGTTPPTFASSPTDVQTGSLRVLYRTANPDAVVMQSRPQFVLVNDGLAPVALARLELVYQLQNPDGDRLEFVCEWASLGCENLTARFSEAGDGRTELRIGFRLNAGRLPAQGDSGEIKVRFHRADGAEYDQRSDPSFGALIEYQAWDRVALYLDGRPVWGAETLGEAAGEPMEPSLGWSAGGVGLALGLFFGGALALARNRKRN